MKCQPTADAKNASWTFSSRLRREPQRPTQGRQSGLSHDRRWADDHCQGDRNRPAGFGQSSCRIAIQCTREVEFPERDATTIDVEPLFSLRSDDLTSGEGLNGQLYEIAPTP